MVHSATVMAARETTTKMFGANRELRVAEKLVLGFLTYLVVESILVPLPLKKLLTVIGLNLLSAVVLLVLTKLGHDDAPKAARHGVATPSQDRRSRLLPILRDWSPCILILVAYREAGLFFIPDPAHRLDYFFIRWDRKVLGNPWTETVLSLCSPWIQHYLEFSYFLCYPMIPLGLGCLYAACGSKVLGRSGIDRAIDRFWTSVLLALFFCYLIFPLFPLTPPRSLFHDFPGPSVGPLFRKVNNWLLGQYSVQACIFPSGHVAGVTATALSLRAFLPRIGFIFLIAAASVAVATVYGRYHYAADALAGALVGVAAFAVSRRIHKS